MELPRILLEILCTHDSRIIRLAHPLNSICQFGEMICVRLAKRAVLAALGGRHAHFTDIHQIRAFRNNFLFLLHRRPRLSVSPRIPLPLLLFLLAPPLHLHRKELPRRPHGILSPSLPPSLSPLYSLAFQDWSPAIEYEDGLDAEEEQFADAAEEADDV